ncbi:flagella synthesis protein FlgN [Marinobacter sp.]|uniref:flagella synthesis protein FlgN n=1 Tax=Marinobacter sp. TaxID=50741 RepID=UPI0038514A3D
MAPIDELKQLLDEDIQNLRDLTSTLHAEKEALRASDIKAIEPLTQAKNSLLEQVRERAKRKIHLLVAMGYRPQTGEPSQFIRSAGIGELTALWQSAEEELKACKELNGRNGRIVGHLQQRLGRLTDIFRGSAGHAKLYGASGQQTSLGHKNILGSA